MNFPHNESKPNSQPSDSAAKPRRLQINLFGVFILVTMAAVCFSIGFNAISVICMAVFGGLLGAHIKASSDSMSLVWTVVLANLFGLACGLVVLDSKVAKTLICVPPVALGTMIVALKRRGIDGGLQTPWSKNSADTADVQRQMLLRTPDWRVGVLLLGGGIVCGAASAGYCAASEWYYGVNWEAVFGCLAIGVLGGLMLGVPYLIAALVRPRFPDQQ